MDLSSGLPPRLIITTDRSAPITKSSRTEEFFGILEKKNVLQCAEDGCSKIAFIFPTLASVEFIFCARMCPQMQRKIYHTHILYLNWKQPMYVCMYVCKIYSSTYACIENPSVLVTRSQMDVLDVYTRTTLYGIVGRRKSIVTQKDTCSGYYYWFLSNKNNF